MVRLGLVACLLVAGCSTAPVVRTVTIRPPAQIHTVTIVRLEKTPIAANRLVCPADPPLPYPPTQKAIGIYIANLLGAADQCRANLESLRK